MPYTNVGDERIFYAYHAGPNRKAAHLILVHGAGGNHQLWGYAMRSLRAATVYALDLPGHRRSRGAGRWSIADYATVVLGFLDALHIDRAVIAGHSMGGAIAMEMALGSPQRVSGLVLVATGARLRVLPAILTGTLSDFQNTVRLVCESAYSTHALAELIRQGERQMLEISPQTMHDDFAACNSFDVIGRLGDIHCPTLVICGTEDALAPPKYAAFLAERIAGAELKLVEGAGHMVIIEQPDVVAQAVEAAMTRWQA